MREIHERPLVHRDTDSVVASELIVAAASEKHRLAVARVASAEGAGGKKQKGFKVQRALRLLTKLKLIMICMYKV